jgi:hypothetical protein
LDFLLYTEKNSWENFGCCQRYSSIGNRIGIYGIQSLFQGKELGLTIEEVDKLTEPSYWSSKSATLEL